MRPTIRVIALWAGIFALANVCGPIAGGTAQAQESPRPAMSSRGGVLAKVGPYQFEVFFYTTGVRAFLQDAKGAPLDASKLTGTATFYHPNSPNPWFERKLAPSPASAGQASESLDLVIDLRTVPPSGARVSFEIGGLPDPAGPTALFSVPFEFVTTSAEPSAGNPATANRHGYAPIAALPHYFPLAGYYTTSVGVVWVPSPGYYHVVVPMQYYPPGFYPPPGDWRLAHPAPSPNPPMVQSRRSDLSGIHTEYYWHSKAMDDQASHEAWIRGQLREMSGSPPRY